MKRYLIGLFLVLLSSHSLYAANECSDLDPYEKAFKEEVEMINQSYASAIKKEKNPDYRKISEQSRLKEEEMCKSVLKGQSYNVNHMHFKIREFIGKESGKYREIGTESQVREVVGSITKCYCQVFINENKSFLQRVTSFFGAGE